MYKIFIYEGTKYDLYLGKQATGVANNDRRNGAESIEHLARFVSPNVVISIRIWFPFSNQQNNGWGGHNLFNARCHNLRRIYIIWKLSKNRMFN